MPLSPSGDPDRLESTALHALVAVAARLGVDTGIDSLRRTYTFRGAEPDTAILVAIARELGLEARGIRVQWADLPQLKGTLPAILRLRDGHAVVLDGIRDEPGTGLAAVVSDPTGPTDAVAVLDRDRLAEVWDGEIILLKRRYSLTDDQQPFGLAWLFGQVLRERRLFVDIGAAAFISTIFVLAPPFIVMTVVDRVLINHSFSTLAVIAAAILVLILFEMALGHLRRYFVQVATTRIDGRLNLFIVERVLKLPMDYFEKNPTGMIMSKVAQIWKVRHFLTGQLFGSFLDAVPLLGLVPALLILEWHMAILVFVLTGIIAVIVYAFMPALGRRYGKVIRAEQAKGSHLVETIYGIRTIKSLALEGRRRHEWDVRVARATQAAHDLGILANYPQTLTLPFERLIYSGAIMLGAWIILTRPDSINPGAVIAFSMLALRLAQPLIQLARLQQDLAEVGGAVGEVASIMNNPPERSRAGGLRLPIEGDIHFQNLSFRYASGAPLALDDVSFRIPRGTMFGIMGRSGSGKTTVTRLLQGLHPGYEGIIKIDGMDLREIELEHLRTSIGVVPQENFLFSGTIRENIAMAKHDASFSEVVRAAQLAGAEEFIERLPRGYDTMLEEGAQNLSGGQRQRLAIARALLINPPVLILDEATSALDAESEAIVNANIQRMARGRTVICISHRLSMLVPADAILVLERGKVYDIGTHEELLQRCDIYKHLWYQQNRYADRGAHAQLAIARTPEA